MTAVPKSLCVFATQVVVEMFAYEVYEFGDGD